MMRTGKLLAAALVMGAGSIFLLIAGLSLGEEHSEPELVSVVLSRGESRKEIAERIGGGLAWSPSQEERFAEALREIQWDAFNQDAASVLGTELEWEEAEREVFLTHSRKFLQEDPDILEYAYVAGSYEFSLEDTPPEVAETLVARVRQVHRDPSSFLRERMAEEALESLSSYVQGELELLPDLLPLPPQDIGLREDNGRTLLVFSTTYYNRGPGNLELVADPETAGVRVDTVRTVFQRILRRDGGHRDRPAGSFLWHEEHLHYHFEDFAEYRLEPVSAESDSIPLGRKATFCIRDMTSVSLRGQESPPAEYLVCGRERQGISVGWGDTYFQTYADQNFDVTGLPSGTYALSLFANPRTLLQEATKDNNESSAIIEIDKEAGTVEVLETRPERVPAFEHVHEEKVR